MIKIEIDPKSLYPDINKNPQENNLSQTQSENRVPNMGRKRLGEDIIGQKMRRRDGSGAGIGMNGRGLNQGLNQNMPPEYTSDVINNVLLDTIDKSRKAVKSEWDKLLALLR